MLVSRGAYILGGAYIRDFPVSLGSILSNSQSPITRLLVMLSVSYAWVIMNATQDFLSTPLHMLFN